MDVLKQILSAQGMWGGVLATLTFVVIGFIVTKTGLFSKEINGKISKFVLQWALPFLCIIAFMQNANANRGKEVGIVIALSVAFYVLMAIVSWLIIRFAPHLVSRNINKKAMALYEKSDKSLTPERYKDAYLNSYRQKLMTIQMMVVYGSLQFFAYPLVLAMQGSVFSPFTLALAQTWCIPYMIAAFSYVLVNYSGEKFSRKNVKPVLKSVFSPMMICLYLSLIVWCLQFIPALNTYYVGVGKFTFIAFDTKANKIVGSAIIKNGTPYGMTFTEAVKKLGVASSVNVKYIGILPKQFWASFRDQLPVFGKILNSGVGIISPLAWIVIGGTLASSDLKAAAKDKDVWITTIRKLFTMPLFIFLCVLPLVKFGAIDYSTGVLLVLFGATPPAAVCVIFSVAYKHEHSGFTAQVSALATVGCLVAMPLWIVIAYTTYKTIAG